MGFFTVDEIVRDVANDVYENADAALSELPLTSTWSLEEDGGRVGMSVCRAPLLSHPGAVHPSSLSEIITVCISIHYVFTSVLHSTVLFLISPLSHLFFQTFPSPVPASLTSPIQSGSICRRDSLPVIHTIFSSSPLLLLSSSSFILPSCPLAAWAGEMHFARDQDTCGTGYEVGDLGFGPSGKDNKSSSCLMSASNQISVP